MKKGYSINQVLSLKQTTVLAPQLQQGVHLLQLSSLDLQNEIEAALETNPFLEKLEIEFKHEADDSASAKVSDKGLEKAKSEHTLESRSLIHGHSARNISSASSQTNSTAGQRQANQSESDYATEFGFSTELTLHSFLHQQAHSTPLSDKQHHILALLVDSVNDNGYLRARVDDIIEFSMPDYVVTKTDVVKMISVLQDFEPVGVGARTASECLLIQLRDKAADTPGLKIARQIAKYYLPQLAGKRLNEMAAALGLDSIGLRTPIALIRQLNPFPGTAIASQTKTYITPDLVVKKIAARWVVRLNPNVAPAIGIYNESDSLLKLAKGKKGYKKLKAEWQNAQNLLSNLEKRYRTMLRVARIIVDRQNTYFDEGEAAFKPLAQKDIAEMLGIHVSTVSRAVNDKYMLTPMGVIELRYFFSTAMTRSGGEAISSKAIQARIAKMIEGEPPQNPLSDNKIAAALKQRGINVARRTVTKYREQANIPASPKRRRT